MQVVLSTCIKSSCGYQVLTSLMEQLGPGLMNASMLMQVARIRLAASCYPQACCKFLSAGLLQVVIHWLVASCYPQACCKLLSSLQVVQTICSKLVDNKS
jgi:hypothetical protein